MSRDAGRIGGVEIAAPSLEARNDTVSGGACRRDVREAVPYEPFG